MTFRSDLLLRIAHATDFTATARACEHLPMKRTLLKRKTPLARGSSSMTRSPMRRSRPKGQPPERSDEPFKAFVRTLSCCAPGAPPCDRWPSEPHHKHGDGKGIKTSDLTCVPLDHVCHRDAESKSGRFKGFTKQQTRDWHDAESARVQGLYDARMRAGVEA